MSKDNLLALLDEMKEELDKLCLGNETNLHADRIRIRIYSIESIIKSWEEPDLDLAKDVIAAVESLPEAGPVEITPVSIGFLLASTGHLESKYGPRYIGTLFTRIASLLGDVEAIFRALSKVRPTDPLYDDPTCKICKNHVGTACESCDEHLSNFELDPNIKYDMPDEDIIEAPAEPVVDEHPPSKREEGSSNLPAGSSSSLEQLEKRLDELTELRSKHARWCKQKYDEFCRESERTTVKLNTLESYRMEHGSSIKDIESVIHGIDIRLKALQRMHEGGHTEGDDHDYPHPEPPDRPCHHPIIPGFHCTAFREGYCYSKKDVCPWLKPNPTPESD